MSGLTYIPVQFEANPPLHFLVKIQTSPPMNHPSLSPEKPLIPALFQIAAHADVVRSFAALKKKAQAQERARLSEKMVDPEKLEAALKAIAKKKKSEGR